MNLVVRQEIVIQINDAQKFALIFSSYKFNLKYMVMEMIRAVSVQ